MTQMIGLLKRTTAVVLAAALLAGAGSALWVGSASAAKKSPPCTKRALTAGLRRGKTGGRIDGRNWACAGHFAFAAVVVHNIEITVLFRARQQDWFVASRVKYCKKGIVPARIYQPACETN